MTPQEAITTLKREYLGDSEYMELAKQMGANALEKQIAKKPKYIEGDYDMPLCPNCGMSVDENEEIHCSTCGQAIDWGDCE